MHAVAPYGTPSSQIPRFGFLLRHPSPQKIMSLFGSFAANKQNSAPNLFGQSTNTSAPSTSAFGSFGQPQQPQQQQQTNPLFGAFGQNANTNASQPAQQQQPTTGLFGQTLGQPQQQQQQQPAQTATTGLFGQPSTTTQPNTGIGLFGASQNTNTNTNTNTTPTPTPTHIPTGRTVLTRRNVRVCRLRRWLLRNHSPE